VKRDAWVAIGGVVVALGAAAGLAVVLWPTPARQPAGTSDARALFQEHCAVCHGAQGKGDGPGARVVAQKIRDFTDAQAMRSVSDRFLFEIIQKGGSQFGRSNAMPAWSMKLSDAEIRELVELIRSFARPGAKEGS
jgi:mono/diheme cytochrome c family protein